MAVVMFLLHVVRCLLSACPACPLHMHPEVKDNRAAYHLLGRLHGDPKFGFHASTTAPDQPRPKTSDPSSLSPSRLFAHRVHSNPGKYAEQIESTSCVLSAATLEPTPVDVRLPVKFLKSVIVYSLSCQAILQLITHRKLSRDMYNLPRGVFGKPGSGLLPRYST